MCRRSKVRDFGLATLLAAGIQLVILVVTTLINKPLERSLTPPSPGYLRVHRSGNVVLEQPYGGYRNLAGQPLNDADVSRWLRDTHAWLSFASLVSETAQRDQQARGDWYSRLAELPGDRRVSWFIVRPQKDDRLAFCVGYDKATKEQIGYLGQKGFHRTLPRRDEWFPATGNLNTRFVSRASIGRAPAGVSAAVATRPPAGTVFLASDDRIWQIDLAAQAVRVLCESPGATCLSAAPDEKPEMLVRTSSAVVAIDLQGRTRTSWKLPAELQNDSLQWYEIADGGVVTETVRQTNDNLYVDFFWLDRGGAVTRSDHLEAGLGLPGGPRVIYFVLSAMTPTPVTLSFLSLVAMPVQAVGQGEQPDFPTAQVRALANAWPALFAIYLISAALAWLAYRRQVRFALPGAGLWAVFVFFLGLPGWLGYRWHRPWPVVQECGACHRPAPRDREACATCGQIFAPPPPLGTEIFS